MFIKPKMWKLKKNRAVSHHDFLGRGVIALLYDYKAMATTDDQLVYELYGLTEEEIKIVEGQ